MDKVILITGTSTGFGRTAAETLAERGTRYSPRCATPRAAMLPLPRPCGRWPSGKAGNCTSSIWTSRAMLP